MNNVKSRFGAGVRKKRLELGFSQEKLADLAGIHRTYLADVERGIRNISLENIVKLITALDITLADFFSNYF